MNENISISQKISHHLPSIDLCRGLAAVVVLLLHMDFLFFGIGDVGYKLFPRGYLCVDFFFLLSGYVIARNYDWKFSEGLTVRSFVGIRFARLWPLAALTFVFGFALEFYRVYQISLTSVSGADLLGALIINLAFLPVFSAAAVFPFNPAAWSIFFEFAINIFYAIFFRFMSIPIISAFALLAAVGLAASAAAINTLDLGWSSSNIFYAWPRVVYSFMLGALTWRLLAGWRPHISAHFLAIALVVAGAVMSIPVDTSDSWNVFYDFFFIVLVSPLLLTIAIATRLPPWANSLAWFLGGISYSVYLWHTPLMVAYSAGLKRLPGVEFNALVPWAGIIFVPLLLMFSYVTWRFFELPAQKLIRNRISRISPKKIIA